MVVWNEKEIRMFAGTLQSAILTFHITAAMPVAMADGKELSDQLWISIYRHIVTT